MRFAWWCPTSKPSSGLVIYDEAVRDAGQVRIDLAVSLLADEGIEASGAVGDADPFLATMDAIGEHRPSEVTSHAPHHALRLAAARPDQARPNRLGAAGEHIVADLESEGLPFRVTLVIANKTASGEELVERLQERAAHGERHLFIAVVPQQGGPEPRPRGARTPDGDARKAARRGAAVLGHDRRPRPYTAAMNALELFRVDDVVISTLPDSARAGCAPT